MWEICSDESRALYFKFDSGQYGRERGRRERKRGEDYFFVKLSHYSRLPRENIIPKVNWELAAERCIFNMQKVSTVHFVFVSISVGFTSISRGGRVPQFFSMLCTPRMSAQRVMIRKGLSLDTAMKLAAICNFLAHFLLCVCFQPWAQSMKAVRCVDSPWVTELRQTLDCLSPFIFRCVPFCSSQKKYLFSFEIEDTREMVFRSWLSTHPWWQNPQT